MSGNLGRWLGLMTLLFWAGVVGWAFAQQHPVPWQLWRRLWHVSDPALLLPTLDGVGAAAGRLMAAAAILGGAASLGAGVLGLLWRPRKAMLGATTPGERFWICVACGLAAYAVCTIMLAALYLLYAPLLWLMVAAPLVIGAAGLYATVRAPATPAETPSPFRLVGTVVAGTAAVVLCGTLPFALSPQVLHDSLVYHLALPQAYLTAHRFVPFPHLIFANTTLNMEMLYTVALSLGGPQTAKLLHGACGLGMLACTVAIGRRVHSTTAGVLAAFITLATPLVIAQWPSSYADLAAGFAFTVAVWGVVVWATSGSLGPLRVAAVALGLFAGMRYTSVYGIVAIGVAVAVVLARKRPDGSSWRQALVPLALGVGVGVAPWLVKNWSHVGNPIFPLATGLFGAGPLLPSEHARTQLLVAQHGMGHGVLDLVLLPWRLTVQGNPGYGTFDGAVTPVWLIALPAVLTWRRMPPVLGLMGVIALVYSLAWAAGTHVARYLSPVFPLYSILAVCALLRLLGPAASVRPWQGGVVLAAWLLAGVWWVPAVAPTVAGGVGPFGPVAWGRESPDDFVWRTEQTAPVYAYMDRALPRDAKVVGLWENRTYRCPRRLEGDAVYEAPRWLDQFAGAADLAAFAAALREQGYTHILWNKRHLARFPPRAASSVDARTIQRGLESIREFTETQCTQVFAARDIFLYEIVPPAAAAPVVRS